MPPFLFAKFGTGFLHAPGLWGSNYGSLTRRSKKQLQLKRCQNGWTGDLGGDGAGEMGGGGGGDGVNIVVPVVRFWGSILVPVVRFGARFWFRWCVFGAPFWCWFGAGGPFLWSVLRLHFGASAPF